jgi:hypothetical protein
VRAGRRIGAPQDGQCSAWNDPSRIAARRSGRRSAFTLADSSTFVSVPQFPQTSATRANKDMATP